MDPVKEHSSEENKEKWNVMTRDLEQADEVQEDWEAPIVAAPEADVRGTERR